MSWVSEIFSPKVAFNKVTKPRRLACVHRYCLQSPSLLPPVERTRILQMVSLWGCISPLSKSRAIKQESFWKSAVLLRKESALDVIEGIQQNSRWPCWPEGGKLSRKREIVILFQRLQNMISFLLPWSHRFIMGFSPSFSFCKEPELFPSTIQVTLLVLHFLWIKNIHFCQGFETSGIEGWFSLPQLLPQWVASS